MKKTAAMLKKELAARLADIERARREAEGQKLEFRALEEKALLRRIKRQTGKSPYIFSVAWTSAAPPGTPSSLRVWYANPDPRHYAWLFVSAFFGLGNFFSDQALAWVGRDTGWPVLGSAYFSLAPGASGDSGFDWVIPNAPKGTYFGNALLWQADYFGRGTLFDQTVFEVKVL